MEASIKRKPNRIPTNTTTTSTLNLLILPYLSVLLLILLNITTANLALADDTPATTTTKPLIVNGTEGEGGAEGGTGGGIILNETKYENYSDVTKFLGGMNDWDFTGSWAKYDLAQLSEESRPLPLVPDADDQGVFICQTSSLPSTLTKEFPALHNATFTLTFYAKADDGELTMTGEVEGVSGDVEALFNQSMAGQDAGTGHAAGTWGTETFSLPQLAAMGDFKLRVVVSHSEKGQWAAAEMRVDGVTGPPLPPITTQAPPIVPQTNVTTNATTANETTTTTTTTTQAPTGNGTTTDVNTNITTTTTSTTTEEEEEEEDMDRLEGIAQAIWDAFYVFLALFCACLVALVALIVHGRCKDDEPPPAVATYNPRTASYRMDKVYDNPSYDNNAV